MGWGRSLLLGNVGTQMNLQELEGDVRDVRQALRRQVRTDRSHDEAIAALRRENQELKMYVGTLVRLLVRKGVVTREEVGSLVELVEREEV